MIKDPALVVCFIWDGVCLVALYIPSRVRFPAFSFVAMMDGWIRGIRGIKRWVNRWVYATDERERGRGWLGRVLRWDARQDEREALFVYVS